MLPSSHLKEVVMTDICITRCAILCASDHCKVIADMAELNGYNEVHFFDDCWPKLSASCALVSAE